MLSPTVFISYKNLYIYGKGWCVMRGLLELIRIILIFGLLGGDFLYHLISDKTTYFYLQKSAKKRMMYS